MGRKNTHQLQDGGNVLRKEDKGQDGAGALGDMYEESISRM